MTNLYYNISKLYPEEKDYIIKQLNLIKHNIYKDLNIRYSMLEGNINNIWIKNDNIDTDTALQLFRLLGEIKIPNISSSYSNQMFLKERDKPSVEIQLSSFVKFEVGNINKK